MNNPQSLMYQFSFLCFLQKEQQRLRKTVLTLITNSVLRGYLKIVTKTEDELMDNVRKQHKK
jgi:hypothetical protein